MTYTIEQRAGFPTLIGPNTTRQATNAEVELIAERDALAQRCQELEEAGQKAAFRQQSDESAYSVVVQQNDALRTEAEQARRTAGHWKAEHLAGNAVIDQLRAEIERYKVQVIEEAGKVLSMADELAQLRRREMEVRETHSAGKEGMRFRIEDRNGTLVLIGSTGCRPATEAEAYFAQRMCAPCGGCESRQPDAVKTPRKLLAELRKFTLEYDSGSAGVLRGQIDALLAGGV